MAGLDALAKAPVNPKAEYERATLAVFDKLRSSHCRPEELSKLLANEDAYSRNLYAKLSNDLNELIELHMQPGGKYPRRVRCRLKCASCTNR